MLDKRLTTRLVFPALALFCTAIQSVPSPSASAGPSGTAVTDMNGLSKEDMKKYAASHFFGFYTVNGTTAGDVCRAEGIDLTAYVRAFQLKHTRELAQAHKVISASGISLKKMTAIAEGKRSKLEATVRQTMLDLAAALGGRTVADGCAYVAAHAADAVSAQSFADQNPEVEAALMTD